MARGERRKENKDLVFILWSLPERDLVRLAVSLTPKSQLVLATLSTGLLGPLQIQGGWYLFLSVARLEGPALSCWVNHPSGHNLWTVSSSKALPITSFECAISAGWD